MKKKYTVVEMTAFQAQVMPDGFYKKSEMLILLGRTLKKRCSSDTFKQWKRDFGVYADEDGYYWQEDLNYLRAWVRFHRKWGRTRTKKDFQKEYRIRQLAKEANDRAREAEKPMFIEVEIKEVVANANEEHSTKATT